MSNKFVIVSCNINVRVLVPMVVEIQRKMKMTWRKLSPEDSECAWLGELKTFTEGTGKEGPYVCEEGASRKYSVGHRACMERRQEHPAGWGDLGGGCRPVGSRRVWWWGSRGSGGLPAGERRGSLNTCKMVNFACLLWRGPTSGGKGCFRLVGEVVEEPKARRKQEVREYRGQGGQLERSFHDPSDMQVEMRESGWLKLLVWEFLVFLSQCEPCGEGQCRRKWAWLQLVVFTEHLLCAAAVLVFLGPLPSAFWRWNCINFWWQEVCGRKPNCESTGLKFPFLFIFSFAGIISYQILCILLCLSYSLLHQSVSVLNELAILISLVQFKTKTQMMSVDSLITSFKKCSHGSCG